MNEQNRIFSMNLKQLLSAKNVSQVEAAKIVGVSRVPLRPLNQMKTAESCTAAWLSCFSWFWSGK